MSIADRPLPQLKVLPLEALQPHEQLDPSRVGPLREALARDGVLRNPPIVLPLDRRALRFMVLDGANRIAALRDLGLPFALVQVVNRSKDRLELETWSQVILGCPPEDLLRRIESSTRLALVGSPKARGNEAHISPPSLARLTLADGRDWAVEVESSSLEHSIAGLHELHAACRSVGRVERSIATSMLTLREVYPDLTGLLVLRALKIDEVLSLARRGIRMPAGITRFVLGPRALRVNYPLDRLGGSASLEACQGAFEAWLFRQIQGRSVRYYAEPTYLFDE